MQNSTLLNDLVQAVNDRRFSVLNVVVRQNGRIVATHDFVPERPRLLWSVSKTFTSMAVGLAAQEGLFKLGDRLLDYFPNALSEPDPRWDRLTVRDLLCMATGHARCPLGGFDNPDFAAAFFSQPLVFEPGSRFVYNNAATYMLGRLVTLTSGCGLRDYLVPRLFEPLEIAPPRWNADQNGYQWGFSGLYLSARDLSKAGQLLLDGGKWQGCQLLPAQYVAEATRPQISTEQVCDDWATPDSWQGYGYQLWMNSYPGSYRMDGYRGQYVVMLPDKNAVVTFVSEEYGRMLGILELTWDTLIDKL